NPAGIELPGADQLPVDPPGDAALDHGSIVRARRRSSHRSVAGSTVLTAIDTRSLLLSTETSVAPLRSSSSSYTAPTPRTQRQPAARPAATRSGTSAKAPAAMNRKPTRGLWAAAAKTKAPRATTAPAADWTSSRTWRSIIATQRCGEPRPGPGRQTVRWDW